MNAASASDLPEPGPPESDRSAAGPPEPNRLPAGPPESDRSAIGPPEPGPPAASPPFSRLRLGSLVPATRGPRVLLRSASALAVLLAALWFLTRVMGAGGWALVVKKLAGPGPGFLALAFLTNLGCYAAWAIRWRALLRPAARVPWWAAQKALMISILVNTLVPFARSLGGLVRASALGRARSIPTGTLYGPTLVDQVGYSAVSLGLGALSVPFAAWSGRAGRGATGAALAAALVVVAAVASALLRRRAALLERIRTRVPAAAVSVEQAIASARAVLFRPATWGVVAAGGGAVWLLNVLTFLLAGRAVGAGFGLAGAAAAWSLGSIAGVATGTPGGIGTTESAAIVPLIALGVPATDALAAVLLARLIHYVSAILIGSGCLLAAGKRRAPEPKD